MLDCCVRWHSAPQIAKGLTGWCIRGKLEGLLQNTHRFQILLHRAEMEGPASVICLRTCCIKDAGPLNFAENPPELGHPHLPRSCSGARRAMRQRRSNSVSMCTLPIIPEYPGFQDIKVCMKKLTLQYLTTTYYFARIIPPLPAKLVFDMIVSFGLCFGIEKLNLKDIYSAALLS